MNFSIIISVVAATPLVAATPSARVCSVAKLFGVLPALPGIGLVQSADKTACSRHLRMNLYLLYELEVGVALKSFRQAMRAVHYGAIYY
jgi:hypothetical protein